MCGAAGRERRLYLGEADKDEGPVDICPAERIVMDGYPGLLHEARWRSEKVFMSQNTCKCESDDVPDLAWDKVSVGSRHRLFLKSLIFTIKRCD